jgi:hypothetical protein
VSLDHRSGGLGRLGRPKLTRDGKQLMCSRRQAPPRFPEAFPAGRHEGANSALDREIRAASQRSRKPLWAVWSTVGSNPTPSAATANFGPFARTLRAQRRLAGLLARVNESQRTPALAEVHSPAIPPGGVPHLGGAGREPRSIELRVSDSSSRARRSVPASPCQTGTGAVLPLERTARQAPLEPRRTDRPARTLTLRPEISPLPPSGFEARHMTAARLDRRA